MIIVFCTNKSDYLNNQCRDAQYCTYPGARWLPILHQKLQQRGSSLISGDVALQKIEDTALNPSDLLIIQEENAAHGKLLIKKGAIPFLIYSWESPIYTPFFYDNVQSLASKFRHTMFFSFAYASLLKSFDPMMNHLMTFPAFSEHDTVYNLPWSQRKFLVMIAANKSANRKLTENKTLKELIYHIYKYISPIFQQSIRHELHKERIKILLHFQNRIALFGSLWDNLSNLNHRIASKLEPIIQELEPNFCKDKIKTISNYKFCICAENVDYPGYVTEKIIDCFRAGVIPIYIGTNEITQHVPKSLFIDYNNFESLESMEKYLDNMKEEDASLMIKNAHDFLKSNAGLKYSDEYFVEKILSLLAFS